MLVDNLRTYENAAQLLVARCEIVSASGVEGASLAALILAIRTVIEIVFPAI